LKRWEKFGHLNKIFDNINGMKIGLADAARFCKNDDDDWKNGLRRSKAAEEDVKRMIERYRKYVDRRKSRFPEEVLGRWPSFSPKPVYAFMPCPAFDPPRNFIANPGPSAMGPGSAITGQYQFDWQRAGDLAIIVGGGALVVALVVVTISQPEAAVFTLPALYRLQQQMAR
jgi:hypothetical protein